MRQMTPMNLSRRSAIPCGKSEETGGGDPARLSSVNDFAENGNKWAARFVFYMKAVLAGGMLDIIFCSRKKPYLCIDRARRFRYNKKGAAQCLMKGNITPQLFRSCGVFFTDDSTERD